ncbi:DsbA family protein [Sphingomonas sp. Leaf25]|uniref:DsbA family protein n=1 Tax=Sphingomonas sp. Leaf25 TaxID=1735692 RepID=UPI0006FBAEEA|nr:DsbA family protein [Sphingomonas sp. Leaf25]KQN05331.1 disulfide bond formation protein DsbA [Sphingomonas sp. Leaf25]
MRGAIGQGIMILVAALAGAGGAILAQRGTAGRAVTETVVRDYILANPEILPEAMRRLQAKEAGKTVAANRAAIVEPFPGAIAGNPNGDVSVVAYLDYACGFCRASLPAITGLIASDPNVRIVYRELPILSPDSRSAAQMALAAATQGRFKPFHDALYAAGRVDAASIARAAQVAGLDQTAARTTANGAQVSGEIERNLKTASLLGFTGTPSWVVGDQVLGGAQTLQGLQAAVAEARKAKTGA